MATAKHTPAELRDLKAQARTLVLEGKLTQKEIGKRLGVSEKTMSAWVNEYGWKLPDEQALVMSDGGLSLQRLAGIVDVQAFGQYLRQRDPPLYRKALGHLAAYILTLSNQ